MNHLRYLLFFFCSATLADDGGRVEVILAHIKTDKSAPIPFIEKRNNKLLKEPLVLTGEITFTEDGVLTKQITQPVLESVMISADSLELQRKGKTKRLSMDRRADIKAFYTGMRALLNGDTETLFEMFDASSSTNDEDWTIDLIPKATDLQKFLDHLTVTGRGSEVLKVLTVQPGGDWQELSFNTEAD